MISSFLNSKKLGRTKANIYILLFCFLVNFKIYKCDYASCKSNSNLNNNNCFSNIIKFEGNKYRAGRFETTKDGGLIIEYSEDAQPGKGRLFYRLTKDGRGYYDDDNPIREINMTEVKVTRNEKNTEDVRVSGRYEARNKLIVLDGDTSGKEYLFSTSSWYSFTELHDLDSGNFTSWFTPDFFNIDHKYIFSYQYDILRQPNSYNYFIIYCQYEKQNDKNESLSEYYYIRKFKFNSFGGSNSYTHIKEVHEQDNENVRLISSFIMKEKSLFININ